MARQKKDCVRQEVTREVLAAYTDFVDQTQRVYAYGYYLEAIEKTGWDEFYEKVDRALMSALGAIRDSRNKRVRERAFTIWGGKFAVQYWIAVPAGLSAAVTVLLYDHLCGLTEYYGGDFGSNLTMELEPFRRYDYGRVVLYFEDEYAGTEGLYPFSDDRPPMQTFFRCWQPVTFPWAERFGPLSSSEETGTPE